MEKQVAVVTGANRGIGLEVSRQLADAGLCVVMTSRDRAKGEAALNSIKTDDRDLHCFALDVTSDQDARDLANYVDTKFGRLDGLVNNAGVLFDDDRVGASVLEVSENRFRTTMEVNFYGPLRLCQTLAPLLRKSSSARIVNMSSGLGQLEGMKDGYPAYGVSKTALNALTRLCADAFSGDGVLVNAMCPGLVATDMGGPQGRPVEEGADTALWLATLPDDGPTGGFFRDRQPIAW